MKRFCALMMVLCLLLGSVSLAEGVTTPTDIATESPTESETPTQSPEPTATAEPTAEPSPSASPEPSATPDSSESPDDPTEAPEPSESPDDPTEAPEPSESPDDPTEAPEPSESPDPTESPEPTEEAPWDESQCDHMTLDCEHAPKCEIEGCEHIAQDLNNLDYPLCDAGRWLLDQQDAYSVMALSNALRIIDIDRADATFYRSGEYAIIGTRVGADVRIAKNRAVILELRNAKIDKLTIESNAIVYISAKDGMTGSIGTLTIGQDAMVIFSQGGALKIDTVRNNGDIMVDGASVRADMSEKTGRRRFDFAASGVQNVLVEGEKYTWTVTPDADGMLYLWLNAPSDGMQWTSAVAEGTMTVRQTAKAPAGDEGTITQGQRNTLKGGNVYTLSGTIADGTVLEIMEENVTVILDEATASGTLIEAGASYDLIIRGETILDGSGSMPLMGVAPCVTVDGLLSVQGSLPSGVNFLSGPAVLSDAPDGYAAYNVSVPLSRQKVTLDGANVPLLMNPSGALLLPACASDSSYSIEADANNVTVTTVEKQTLTFTLTEEAPNADAADAKEFIVNGRNDYLDGTIHSAGVRATATLRTVQLHSSGSVLRVEDGSLNVTLTGNNALLSDGEPPIAISNASVTLNVDSGRLVIRGQSSLDGITLKGNILVEGSDAQECTTITIKDAQGNPVPNVSLKVLIGGQQYQYTTHYDGTLRLWGFENLDGTDIAATDGENVYTAVITDKSGTAVTGLEITNIAMVDQEDGSLVITFTADGAKTAGVQLYSGEAPASMPDTYQSDAAQYTAVDGKVTVSGLKAGDIVIFRVYASAEENVTLSADNTDGFSFSDECFHVHRVKWTPSRTANATYSGKTYRPRMTLPETATVTYSGNSLIGGLPFYVGSYVMHVKIPEGDPLYLPGTADISFSINKITLIISPDANQQKNEGEADPSRFTYTVIGLLDGDTVRGTLSRAAGEEAGNYAFDISNMSAADYYTLKLADDAAEFTILPSDINGGGGGGERLTPVQQSIERKDGRKMFVTITTQEQLVLSYSELGSVVRNTPDDKARPFTPSLVWNSETDEVLLRISAEAELNKDGGYVTDSYGSPVYGSRTLRFGYMSLKYMNNAGVDCISFSNKNAAVMLRLTDFLSEDMEKAIKQAGGNLTTTVFRITIEPVDLPDGAVSGGWNVRTEMVINRNYIDISSLLPNASVLVSLEPVAKLLTSLDRYDEKTFSEGFLLRMNAVNQESMFIAPYQDDELTKVPFTSILFSDRYLIIPLTEAGTADIAAAPVPEEDASATD